MDESTANVSTEPLLTIGGQVERPLRLDIAALREFESVSLPPFDLGACAAEI
ncbi:hypothetical protein AWB78_03788 [Caballeronia calidae]|uniref:Uncharacterized protein n=1 Tax=Caballeronia calidae TaxID=1777139 RepID=A0A158CFD6_9BURK|nr:hypothetical protein [Caballeronia calidae]SAK80237.1 hypothetical protein AWB78_03788 [Caballeronia calidae]